MDVDNFFFGMQAVSASVVDTLRVTSRYPMFIGFIIGFGAASIIHAMLTAEHVKHIPSMVLHDPSVSFQKMYPAGSDGTFTHSYTDYAKNVERMKTIFYSSTLLIILLLMLATATFK